MLIEVQLERQLKALGGRVKIHSAPQLDTVRPDALLHLDLDDAHAVFVVEAKNRPPYPSEVEALDPLRDLLSRLGAPLLIAPYISIGEGEALCARGWSWADADGNFDLRSGTIRLRQRLPLSKGSRSRTGLPRIGGGLAVVRALIVNPRYFTDSRLTQIRLAAATGVTQARVAQVFAQLREADLLSSKDGTSREDRARLLDAFLDQYSGPGGEEEYLYGLDPPNEVARRFAKRTLNSWLCTISADVGPDLIAPVRSPTILIVYVRGPATFDRTGLVRAEGRGDANVIVRSPRDSSVFGSDSLPLIRSIDGASVRLADPAQMIWDLHQLGGEDRAEAADRLKRWVLESP